jgi:hypothetical protein
MTIGEKIPPDRFTEVKKRFIGYQIRHECEIKDFSLAYEENGKWEIMRVFGLAG